MSTVTKAQLLATLATLGVAAPRKGNVATLTALVAQHTPAAPTPDAAPATPDAAPLADTPASAVAEAIGLGLKIERNRETRNGVTRPSIGGRCRAVWDACDAHAQATGDDPTASVVRTLAAAQGWNPNNASIEFYQWRKFNGITGRTPKAAPAPVAQGEQVAQG